MARKVLTPAAVADQRASCTEFQRHGPGAFGMAPVNHFFRLRQPRERHHVLQAGQEDVTQRHGLFDAHSRTLERPQFQPQIGVE